MSLQQNDFRQMLIKGKEQVDSTKYSTKKEKNKRTHAPHTTTKRKYRPKDSCDDDEEEHIPSANYRDRAAERRTGIATDVQDEIDQLREEIGQVPVTTSNLASTSVKGLDLALLARLKSEKQALLEAKDRLEKKGSNTMDGADNGGARYRSTMGRKVHELMQKPTGPRVPRRSELFLPGRMYHEMNLYSKDANHKPVSIQRGKGDSRISSKSVSGHISEFLMTNLDRCRNDAMAIKARRRKWQDEAEARLEAEKARYEGVENDDEDIFADAGEYVAEGAIEGPKQHSRQKMDYFSNLSAKTSKLEKEERELEAEKDRLLKFEIQQKAKQQEELEKQKRLEDKLFGSGNDGYSECYPEFLDTGGYESEEEGKKDKDNTDDAPAASESRAKRRKLEKSKDQKLDSDLKKIHKIMEKKHGRTIPE